MARKNWTVDMAQAFSGHVGISIKFYYKPSEKLLSLRSLIIAIYFNLIFINTYSETTSFVTVSLYLLEMKSINLDKYIR